MIHCFHGLFGTPSMWENLVQDADRVFHDLYNNFQKDQVKIGKEDVLIGYSLGGRIALEIAAKNNFQIKCLILISSHPGLQDEEIEERVIWEENIISKLKHESKESFFKYWNDLPIFSKNKMAHLVSDDIYQKSLSLFQNNLLSKQPNYWNKIIQHKDKIFYLYGTEDHKYSKIAKRLEDEGLKTISFETDHRVYFCKEEVKKFLNKEIQR